MCVLLIYQFHVAGSRESAARNACPVWTPSSVVSWITRLNESYSVHPFLEVLLWTLGRKMVRLRHDRCGHGLQQQRREHVWLTNNKIIFHVKKGYLISKVNRLVSHYHFLTDRYNIRPIKTLRNVRQTFCRICQSIGSLQYRLTIFLGRGNAGRNLCNNNNLNNLYCIITIITKDNYNKFLL